MDMRWRYLLTLLMLGVAFASEEEDSIPDAGVDDSGELALDQEETRNLRPRAYTPTAFNNQLPSGFRPTPSLEELAGYQQRPQEQEEYVQQPRPTQQLYIEEPRPQIQRVPQRKPDQRPARLQHQQRPIQQAEEELEEEEKVEPDRLSELLQQSKFNCVSKQTGYYADEELNCEVFHYCQDNVKHSWICPDGFTFHQVHLICMPPTHDNICQRSSKYHYVNDYLYKPINEEEVQRKPNVSLRYSERYYPAEVYRDDRYEREDEEEEEASRRHPPAPAQLQARPNQRPQVFRSAEEVNIPLVQRRPQRPYEFDF